MGHHFLKNPNLSRLCNWKNLKPSFRRGSSKRIPPNTLIDESHLKEKALRVAASQGIDGFQALISWINHFKKIHDLVYKTTSGESATVNPKTVMDWKSEEQPKIIDEYQPKDVFNVDETGLFYNLQPSKMTAYKGDSCHGGTKSKQRITVLPGCNADGTEKLPPLATGKYDKPHCFRNIEKLPTKYTAISNSWMTSATFEECLVQLDLQIAAKHRKILFFIDHCAAHPRVNTALKN